MGVDRTLLALERLQCDDFLHVIPLIV